MIYTVKRIDEDLDFGCEERPKGMPVMAIVTLTNSSDEEIKIKDLNEKLNSGFGPNARVNSI